MLRRLFGRPKLNDTDRNIPLTAVDINDFGAFADILEGDDRIGVDDVHVNYRHHGTVGYNGPSSIAGILRELRDRSQGGTRFNCTHLTYEDGRHSFDVRSIGKREVIIKGVKTTITGLVWTADISYKVNGER